MSNGTEFGRISEGQKPAVCRSKFRSRSVDFSLLGLSLRVAPTRNFAKSPSPGVPAYLTRQRNFADMTFYCLEAGTGFQILQKMMRNL